MRIISKFQDYYDSGLAYGIDKELLFQREVIHLGKNSNFIFNNDDVKQKIYIKDGFVYFCGEIYKFKTVIEVDLKKFPKGLPFKEINNLNSKYSFFYNTEDLWNYIPEMSVHNTKRYLKYSEKDIKKRYNKYFNDKNIDIKRNFKFLENTKIDGVEFDHIQLLTKTPYFIFRDFSSNIDNANKFNGEFFSSLEVLGILKQVQFHKVINPYTAFQDISMWIAAQKSENELKDCEIEDKYRIKGHGFNCMSFRKSGLKDKKCK